MMASRRTLLVLGILLAVLILATLHETEAKGSRTSRRTGTRKTRNQRTQRRPSNSNPKVKPKTFHSSVKYSQTRTQTTPFNTRFSVAAATGVVTYQLLTGPVYSRRYRPYHETSYIAIPDDRALKIKNESYHVLTRDGSRCPNGNLSKYEERNVLNVTTKISYQKVKDDGTIKNITYGEKTDSKETNLTISSEAINNFATKIEVRIAFNQSILTNTTSNTTIDLTNCTIMVYESFAYVVESFAFRNEASFVLFLFALFVSIMN